MKPPFFIVGVQRSGTTLLSKMLGKHPEVLMEDRAKSFRLVGAFENMYVLHPNHLDLNYEEFIRWMLYNDKNERAKTVINESLIQARLSVRSLISDSIRIKCQKEGKSIYGDKAPNLQHYMKYLLQYIPEAKFVHIVRDGRASVASMKKRSYRNHRLSADMWVRGNSCGIVNQMIVGEDKYLILKYEDLLLEPNDTLKKVCTFLGIEFNEEMLNFGSEPQNDGENYVKSFLDTSKLSSWKEELSVKEISHIESIQHDLLKHFDYFVESTTVRPLKERTRIWLSFRESWSDLWRRKKLGLKDWQIVEYEDSFRKRFGKFALRNGQLFLSERLFKSLFSKSFYKRKRRS